MPSEEENSNLRAEEFFNKNLSHESNQHSLGFKDLFRLSFRIFRTKPLRTVLTVLGMSMGVGIVLYLTSLGYGLQYLLVGRLVTTEDSLITLETYYPPESQIFISLEDINEIKSLPEVGEISPVVDIQAAIAVDGRIEEGAPAAFALARIVNEKYSRLSGILPDIGDEKNAEGKGVVVSSAALTVMNLPIDKESLGRELDIVLFYPEVGTADETTMELEQVGLKEKLPITGILTDQTLPPLVTVSDSSLTQGPPHFDKLLVKAKNADLLEPLRDSLLEKGFLVSSRVDLVNQIKKIMTIVTITLAVFGITALVVSAIGMFNTMVISFLERVFEVGIMKAIGATNRDIRNLFLMESLIMGILGGLGGIVIGYGLGELTNLGLYILAKNLGGTPIDLFVRPWWFLLLIVVTSSLIGLLSGFWPARRATNVSPKEAFLRK